MGWTRQNGNSSTNTVAWTIVQRVCSPPSFVLSMKSLRTSAFCARITVSTKTCAPGPAVLAVLSRDVSAPAVVRQDSVKLQMTFHAKRGQVGETSRAS